mgnify:CR=1 FL=1
MIRGLGVRSLEEVAAEIFQLEQETEGLLKRMVSFGGLSRFSIKGSLNIISVLRYRLNFLLMKGVGSSLAHQESNTMLEKLILYFVCKTKGRITKTQLVKFLYLADLYSVKWTGKQLTDLNWCYYNHGPWNRDIDATLDSMRTLSFQKDGNAVLITVNDESLFSIDFDFSEGLKLILENIRREWSGSGSEKFDELLDYVYSTAPMVEAKSKHRPEEQVQLNLQLEREKLLEELGV